MADPRSAADGIESRLRALGTPERAAAERRYLKSELDHLGATVPQIRREVGAAAKLVSRRAELLALVRALWAVPVHERRAAAAFLLVARADLAAAADTDLIRELVREARTWAIVDVLADALGALLVREPAAAARLGAWAADPDFWVRRALLLAHRAPLKAGAPFDAFARLADGMLDEREFFIRKAIGWVLREAGRTRPDEVVAWLLPRAHRASGVTVREAVKYLPPERRSAVLQASGGRARSPRPAARRSIR